MRKALLLVGSCVGLAMVVTIMLTTQPFAAPQSDLQKYGAERSQPAGAADHHAGNRQHAGSSGEASLGCRRALQWQGFVELGKR